MVRSQLSCTLENTLILPLLTVLRVLVLLNKIILFASGKSELTSQEGDFLEPQLGFEKRIGLV